MKKLIALMVSVVLLAAAGCSNVSDLIEETPTPEPTVSAQPTPEVTEEPQNKIAISKNLKMTNDWTIMGDFDFKLTGTGKADRIVLATSAKTKNGEMVWDDSQYWTLAVISEDGAYNLFSQRMTGYVYAEVNEIFVRGIATPVVTAYIFSGADREIRNYTFEDDFFVEEQVFNTKAFSTGGINNMYSTFPEYKPQ